MTPQERVIATLNGQPPDRIPRHCWILPAAANTYPHSVREVESRFPSDIVYPPMKEWNLPWSSGSATQKGVSIDAWGSEWTNIQDGIIGEVKNPLVRDYETCLEKIRIPYPVVGQDNDLIRDFMKETDKFVLGGLFSLSTRMEALRGSENLLMDYAGDMENVIRLRDIVHDFNLKYIAALLETDIHGLFWGDDWGSQSSLLIHPETWRKVFKPCYRQYCDMIHDAGKYAFMHSDGYIMEIYPDLIEIGVDAVNSQIFCMPIEEIGDRFAGRITFWGEIDRQNLLVHADEQEIRRAVHRVWDHLSSGGAKVIAQLEFGLEAKPENVLAAFDEWDKITP